MKTKTGLYFQDPKYRVGRADFIFDPSLVLYLPLYKLDGASFMSKDAYGHLCTNHGSIWTPRGRSFDGIDNGIQTADHPALRIDDEITISCWFFPRTARNSHPVTNLRAIWGASWFGYAFDTRSDRRLWFRWGDGGWPFQIAESSGLYALNSWNLYDVTLKGLKEMRMFLNGQLDTEVVPTRLLKDSSMTLWAPASWSPFDGLIGETRIYNRALSPLEIQHNYLATKWRYR